MESTLRHRRQSLLACLLILPLAAGGCGLPIEEEAEPDFTQQIEAQGQGLGGREFLQEFIPPELLTFADAAGELAGAYSNIKAGIAVLEQLGIMLGWLQPRHKDPFVAIYRKIDEAVAQVLWRINGLDRSNRNASAITAVEEAVRQARNGQRVDEIYNRDSHLSVNQALEPIQWERKFDDATTGPWRDRNDLNYWLWKDLFKVSGRPVEPPGTYDASENGRNVRIVWDWRLGLPQLMQMIALRVQVIAAIDPEFRARRSSFAPEFLKYKEAVEAVVRRMKDGVQCTGHLDWDLLWVGCADVHTGASKTTFYNLRPYFVNGELKVNVPVAIENLSHDLRRDVEAAMPFAQLQNLINTLDSYANPRPDYSSVGGGLNLGDGGNPPVIVTPIPGRGKK